MKEISDVDDTEHCYELSINRIEHIYNAHYFFTSISFIYSPPRRPRILILGGIGGIANYKYLPIDEFSYEIRCYSED